MLSEHRLAATLSLTAAMVLTGANVAVGKAIVLEIPVYTFMLFRFLVASAALVPLAHYEPGPKHTAMSGVQLGNLAFMALLGMVGFTALMFEGLKRTSAADAGIILAALPAVIAVLGILITGDRPSRLQLAAVGLCVAGLLLVQVAGSAHGTSDLLGNLMVGGAVLCEASFVILGKRLAPPYRALRLALGANVVGLLLAAPLALLEPSTLQIGAISSWIWLLATWYALAASVFCLWLWYRGLPYVETWLAGLATSAVPVAALAASALFLGEAISGWKLSGAALVVAGIVLGALSGAQRTPTTAT